MIPQRLHLALGAVLILLTVGCGGPQAPSAAEARVVPQPTPDPTLDAVVRGGAAWLPIVTPTPTATAVVVRAPSRATAPRPAAATPTRTTVRSR